MSASRRLSALNPARQRGAAIVTALLVVVLATAVVSSLFVRESVALRSVENRLSLSQTRWIERAASTRARATEEGSPAPSCTSVLMATLGTSTIRSMRSRSGADKRIR